ncbi:ATP-dependent helicase HrpB [Pseudomonas veronii]|uniref:ATP-dependent helicase HrpB n=1 Tax=Pseudomonas veronii TaxID=76761 RepID=A0A7Y0ZXX5_PSEVE|nr:ATP-dependent helicase HrpB [Pseudomonas veronii]KRP62777.1 ATP-dependent helicase [Pseudomonas veronii]NMY00079.1 ATP-dependent helicase HrpB [Pseudomonas veronii]OPK00613.1 ATP-dependent helicase HrpB [Pseudomonas veronii]SEB32978.1 ATP-dependent helicase HrpB [Pseudomonas marginalis]
MISLPIDLVLPDLREALANRHEVILEAPPGAGKTTRVPLALLNEPWLGDQKILMLEPRRLAARAAAERLASELSEKVGETVGYRIRLESKVGPRTQIEVVTEGILARRLQDDPALDGVGVVIFDEYHLRNLDSDLALALCLSARELLRDEPPLKLLLMSATLEGARLSKVLNDAPVVTSEGRMYPVSTVWGSAYQPGERIDARVTDTCLAAINEQPGSVLVFLPGQAEIRRVAEALKEQLSGRPEVIVCPLYGDLDLNAQRAAINPAPQGSRKIVLATNIAETSLTIEGVRVVVDSGLERVPKFDPRSGMTRLDTQRISKASATQRAGRAGRLEPGVCYRLWSESQHEQMAGYSTPEILQADLAALALQLARWGMKPEEMTWLDQPPSAPFAQARDLLKRLGALDDAGQLTPHGSAMSELPAHPRIAHMLIKGNAMGLDYLACNIAALLGEKDVLRGAGADLHIRLSALSGDQHSRRGGGSFQRVKQSARQYRSLLRGRAVHPVSEPDHPRWVGCLLAFAYPDRVGLQRRASASEYRLSNGRAAVFSEPDALTKHEWLVVADLGSRQGQREERIYLASDLDPALFDDELADLVRSVDEVDWDEREGVLKAERQLKVGQLVLSATPSPSLDEQVRSLALVNLVRRKGIELLPWNPELRQWQARVNLLRQLDIQNCQTESKWPDLSDTNLLDTLEEWLAPYLGKVSRLSHFSQLDLSSIVRNLLPWPLPQELETQAPQTIQVPSGSNIRIDYSQHPPILAVRLQELFGLSETPRIAQGKQPLTLHLLSPARRPVQVTQDLANFWRSTYVEVKKDLKGRYPKLFHKLDPWVESLNNKKIDR